MATAGRVFPGEAPAPIVPGKPDLRILSERPLNAETPAHLLDDAVTRVSRMFVRNNGIPPDTRGIDPLDWALEVSGEACLRPQRLTLRDLKTIYDHVTLKLQLECGGNGRAEYHPPVSGNPWTTGAVACPEWTGVRLRDVLDSCGVARNAVYVAYESADTHLSGDPSRQPISRGVPVAKALEPECMIAWAMNGEALAPLHGFPVAARDRRLARLGQRQVADADSHSRPRARRRQDGWAVLPRTVQPGGARRDSAR